ncbi:MAG TPA: SpoIIE family protein phosphatase [Thermoanaerobaculia bacterium]|nr:SpoIIE family protein phosphatase [Thermoanaerobaculia bacterium]
MKIRTQLILAFLLLSVLPLTGIVLYSYFSSEQAVREAQQNEAEQMARQMDRRVTEVREEVGSRVARLGDLPFAAISAHGELGHPVAGHILSEMGDVAPFVESIEFLPANPEIIEETEPNPPSEPSPVAPAPPVPAAPAVAAASAPPLPPPFPSVVINIDQIMQEVSRSLEASRQSMSEQDQEQIAQRVAEATEVAERIAEAQGDAAKKWSRDFEIQMEAWSDLMEAEGELRETEAELRATPDENRRARLMARVRQRSAELEAKRSAMTSTPGTRFAPVPRVSPTPAVPMTPRTSEAGGSQTTKVVVTRPAGTRTLTTETKTTTTTSAPAVAQPKSETSILFGGDLHLPVTRSGEVIGEIRPRIRAGMLLESLIGLGERSEGEIAFAIDHDGKLYTQDPEAKQTIESLGLTGEEARRSSRRVMKNWVVATSRDDESGLTLGIARPIREPLEEIRRAAGRNFAYGLGLIGIALIGIIPIANHMTRDVQMVTEGAERIAQGDLDTEVPVRSKNEFGSLALAFNRMAGDLRDHQARRIEEERSRKEQEIERRLFAAEFDRKSSELEEARRFQLSLLPKELPSSPDFSVAVHMRTATEVGGDYYDFHLSPEGGLSIAVGDATGHGARAGTMVTIVKSLFSTFRAGLAPSQFLIQAGEAIRRMDLERMTMALTLATIHGRTLTISAAGMPPVLVYRARKATVEEIAPEGMPLGNFGGEYQDISAELDSGDTLLLMSDGFPELLDLNGEPLGYPAVEAAFGAVGSKSPEEIIAALSRAADDRTSGQPPNDDITFVVIRMA